MQTGHYFLQGESVNAYSDQIIIPDFGQVLTDSFSDGPDVFINNGTDGTVVGGVHENGYLFDAGTKLKYDDTDIFDATTSNFTAVTFFKLPRKIVDDRTYFAILNWMLPDADNSNKLDIELSSYFDYHEGKQLLDAYIVFNDSSRLSFPGNQIEVEQDKFLMLAVSVDYPNGVAIIYLDGTTKVANFTPTNAVALEYGNLNRSIYHNTGGGSE